MSMKVPEIIRQTKEALQNGYSVIIGLQTTGEVGPVFSENVLMEITPFLSLKTVENLFANLILTEVTFLLSAVKC